MTLEQRVDFHKSLASVMRNDKLPNPDRNLLRELRQAIRDMCLCWPCSTHEAETAVYLGCEYCHVCALHSATTDVYAGKR